MFSCSPRAPSRAGTYQPPRAKPWPRIAVRDVRRSGRLVGRRRWAQRLSGCGVATGAVCVERGSEPGYRLGVLGRAGKPDEDRQDLLLGQSFLGYPLTISCPQCAGELGKRSTQRDRESGGEKLERLVQGRRVWQVIKRIGLRCSRFGRRLGHACQPGLVALSRGTLLGSWSRFWLLIVWLRLALGADRWDAECYEPAVSRVA